MKQKQHSNDNCLPKSIELNLLPVSLLLLNCDLHPPSSFAVDSSLAKQERTWLDLFETRYLLMEDDSRWLGMFNHNVEAGNEKEQAMSTIFFAQCRQNIRKLIYLRENHHHHLLLPSLSVPFWFHRRQCTQKSLVKSYFNLWKIDVKYFPFFYARTTTLTPQDEFVVFSPPPKRLMLLT